MRRKSSSRSGLSHGPVTRDLGLLLGVVGLALPLWAAESTEESDAGRRRIAVAASKYPSARSAPDSDPGAWVVAANTIKTANAANAASGARRSEPALSSSTRNIGAAVRALQGNPAPEDRAESWVVAANTAPAPRNTAARPARVDRTPPRAGFVTVAQAGAVAARAEPATAPDEAEVWVVAANTAPARPPRPVRPQAPLTIAQAGGAVAREAAATTAPPAESEVWVVAANTEPARSQPQQRPPRPVQAEPPLVLAQAETEATREPAGTPAAPADSETWVVAVNTAPVRRERPLSVAQADLARNGENFGPAASLAEAESWVVAANSATTGQHSASSAQLVAQARAAEDRTPAPERVPTPPTPAPVPVPTPTPAPAPAAPESWVVASNSPRGGRFDGPASDVTGPPASPGSPGNLPAGTEASRGPSAAAGEPRDSWTVAATMIPQAPSPAKPKFNTAFLQGAAQGLDVDELISSQEVLPGTYQVDVLINRQLAMRREIVFARNPRTGKVEACISLALLEDLGIDMSKLPKTLSNPEDRNVCRLLPELFDQASVTYDQQRLRLEVSVPQAYMLYSRRGFVDRALWDSGVPVGFVNYNVNARHDTGGFGGASSSYNIGMRNGLNLGAWRLRNNGNLGGGSNRNLSFNNGNTFVQRDIAALDSQLVAGQTYTNTQLFDSVSFRGAQIYSDDAMLPDSATGYAPVIRGTADSNATVEVRQNGFLLLSTNVAPGPFQIDDLLPAGSNGDLEITVIEADGRRRVSRMAFATAPLMVREGRLVHAAAAGRIESNYAGLDDPYFWSGEAIYGLNNDISLRGGLQFSSDYQAAAFGAGFNTRIGAVSLDLLHSSSSVQNPYGEKRRNSGQALRLRYGRLFDGTGTSLNLSAQQHLGEGFRNLSEHLQDSAVARGGTWSDGWYWPNRNGRVESSLDLSLNTALGDRGRWGNIYTSLGAQRYDGGGNSQSLSAGYSNSWGKVGYSVSVSHNRIDGASFFPGQFAGQSRSNTQLSVTLSVPLGSSPASPSANFSVSNDSRGGTIAQSGLSGQIPGDLGLAYSAQVGRGSDGTGYGSAGMSARTPIANVNGGYSYGDGRHSLNFGAYGSVVAHQGGINLGQQIGETFSLAQVDPPTPGIALSQKGATTGWNGYAIVPHMQPYRVNWVTLDPSGLDSEIEIENSTQQTVPSRGAVTVVNFNVSTGIRVQFELRRADGSPVPFGTVIEDEKGERLGMTDPSGRALALLKSERGSLRLRFGGVQCIVPFELPEKADGQNYQRVRLQCVEEQVHASGKPAKSLLVE